MQTVWHLFGYSQVQTGHSFYSESCQVASSLSNRVYRTCPHTSKAPWLWLPEITNIIWNLIPLQQSNRKIRLTPLKKHPNPLPEKSQNWFFLTKKKILRGSREGGMLDGTERSARRKRILAPGRSVLRAAPGRSRRGRALWHALINLRWVIDSNERGWLPPLTTAPSWRRLRPRSPAGRTAGLPFNLLLLPPQLIEISFIFDVL